MLVIRADEFSGDGGSTLKDNYYRTVRCSGPNLLFWLSGSIVFFFSGFVGLWISWLFDVLRFSGSEVLWF